MGTNYHRPETNRFAAERRGGRPIPARPEEIDENSEAPDEPPASSAPPPYATIGLLGLITAIFMAMTVAGHGDVTRVALQFGAKDNSLIQHGQYWRLVTPIFLHGGWLHLLVNGFSLYRLGGSMERIYGRRKYLLIFLFAGVAGNVLSYRLSPTLSLGASGALFGLVGAGLVFPIRFHALIPPDARSSILRQLAMVAIINLGIGFSLSGIIDNWAHVGGLLGGAFIALFLIPDVLEARPVSRLANSLVTALLLAGAGIVVASWVFQWRWARVHPLISLIGYVPVTGRPWWTVSVPSRWRYANGVWLAQDGASIRISEHLLADRATQLELLRLAAQPVNTELDGKPGWYYSAPRQMAYRIPIYDRVFDMAMIMPDSPTGDNDKSDFALVARSVRFILPPVVFATAR